jgi:mono/diheme cytochrome c family protein
MSEDSKKIIAVVVGTLVTIGLAILVGAWLLQGHPNEKLTYQEATTPKEPDPTVFPTVVGKSSGGLDLPEMFTTSPKAVARGKQLLGTYCAVCHGAAGKGDGPAAAGLKPPPRNFTSPKGWTRGYTIADLYTTITEGVKGTGMGAFDMIAPADRFALAHYIQSLGHFDHHDHPAEEIEQLNAKYHLSGGVQSPNKVSVPTIMKHQEAEYTAPPTVRMPPASDSGVGAALVRRLVADPVRAAQVLSGVPHWRTDLDAFAAATMGDTPRNGFRAAVATLDRAQWTAFHDELVKQTPVPEQDGAGGTKG